MKEFLHDENRYRKCFDQFEYLVSLQHAYLRKKQGRSAWGPIGCFGWRHRGSDYNKFTNYIENEAVKAGNNWQILDGGLFDGDIKNFLEIKKNFDEFVAKQTFGWIP